MGKTKKFGAGGLKVARRKFGDQKSADQQRHDLIQAKLDELDDREAAGELTPGARVLRRRLRDQQEQDARRDAARARATDGKGQL